MFCFVCFPKHLQDQYEANVEPGCWMELTIRQVKEQQQQQQQQQQEGQEDDAVPRGAEAAGERDRGSRKTRRLSATGGLVENPMGYRLLSGEDGP